MQMAMPDLIRVEEAEKGILFQNVDLFAATDASLVRGMDVFVWEDRIEAVQPTGGVVPEGALVFDGRGRTLMPGLIDAHVHVSGTPAAPWDMFLMDPRSNIQAFLGAGVTTVVDMGGDAKTAVDIRDAIDSGEVTGPRMYITGGGPVTAKGGHPIPALTSIAPFPLDHLIALLVPTVSGPEDARGAVEAVLKHRPDHFKIVYDSIPDDSPHMTKETLVALIDEAHRVGLPVSVHIGTAQDAVDAVEAGADRLAHGIYQGEATPEQLQTIVQADVPIIYTAWAFEATGLTATGTLPATDLDRLLTPSRALDAVTGKEGSRILDLDVVGEMAQTCAQWHDERRRIVGALHDAGATILAGSDGPFFGVWGGSALHHDLEELVASGFTPGEALLSATANSARMLEENPDYGTVEAGKVADLLLVEGNPLEDIRHSQNIVLVVRAGKLVKLAALHD